MMRPWGICTVACVLTLSAVSSAIAADPAPQAPQDLWSGRLADKVKATGLAQAADPQDQPQHGGQKPTSPAAQFPAQKPREPQWLRRMDKNERAMMTGGWKLQNWSGGTQTQTSAGDRSGTYAPNSYQGAQFQQWNNVSNRQNVPSWNGTTQNFPRKMWSQGYVSPNNYAGPQAQSNPYAATPAMASTHPAAVQPGQLQAAYQPSQGRPAPAAQARSTSTATVSTTEARGMHETERPAGKSGPFTLRVVGQWLEPPACGAALPLASGAGWGAGAACPFLWP